MHGTRAVVLIAVVALVIGALSPTVGLAGEDRPVRTEPRPGRVALTFDDGPDARWTQEVLDTLAAQGVHATFFVSGWRVERHPEVIAAIVAAGHSVQSHGFRHDDMTGWSVTAIKRDIEHSIEVIMAAGAPRPRCFRPPYGGVSRAVRTAAAELGLSVVMWDLDSADYALQNSGGVIEAVLTRIRVGDVVLMHDTWGSIHRRTLPVIVAAVEGDGMGFDVICSDAPVAQSLTEPDHGRKANRPSRL